MNIIPKIPPIALLIAGVLALAYGMSLLTAATQYGDQDSGTMSRGFLIGAVGVLGIISGCLGLAFRKAR